MAQPCVASCRALDITFWGPVRDQDQLFARVNYDGTAEKGDEAMEALRTKVDSLEWEVHRLEAENRLLREANPEASERLEEGRGGVSGTSTGVGAAISRGDKCGGGREEKSRLRGGPSGGAGERVTVTRGGDAGRRPREGRGKRTRGAATGCGPSKRGGPSPSKEGTCGTSSPVRGARTVRAAEEVMLQRTELERYCAAEEERRRWEARESRLYSWLEAVEEELKAAKTASDDGDSNCVRGQMQHLICPGNVSHSIQTGGNEENSQPCMPNPRITDESHSTLGEDEIPVTRPVTEDVHHLLPSQGCEGRLQLHEQWAIGPHG